MVLSVLSAVVALAVVPQLNDTDHQSQNTDQLDMLLVCYHQLAHIPILVMVALNLFRQ